VVTQQRGVVEIESRMIER